MVTYHFDKNSFENSAIVKDYPYGSLKAEMHFFVESRDNKGWRAVTQSINPKNGKVNSPKKNTYHALPVFIKDEDGFMTFVYVPDNVLKLKEFIAEFKEILPKEVMDIVVVFCECMAKYAFYKKEYGFDLNNYREYFGL